MQTMLLLKITTSHRRFVGDHAASYAPEKSNA